MTEAIPLFFDDELGPARKKVVLKQLPPTPETGWRPPTHFPNLAGAKLLSFDVETWEPDFDHGPGWARGHGHIVGIGIGADDGMGNMGKWYFPVRHQVEPQFNLDPYNVFNFVRDTLERTPKIPKVGANLTYDIGWLTEENIRVQGELHDVQFAEALLSEDSEVALGSLGVKYLHENKTSDLMYQWQAQAYGGAANSNQRANIYRTSPRLVGHYGEGDVDLPLRVLRQQWPLLEKEGLLDVYRMENDLIYLMVKMRQAGVTVDIPAAERLYAQLGIDLLKFHSVLCDTAGTQLNYNSGRDIALAFDKLGLTYPKTSTGAPSFVKDYLKNMDHPIGDMILECRMLDKVRGTFLKSYILERHNNGKIHAIFNQLRGDGTGTGVGRFSSQAPNLQNVSVRPGVTEEKLTNKKDAAYDPTYVPIGQRVRSLFIPDQGHVAWEKGDFSQIQYRGMVHYAIGPGAEDARQAYLRDPKTDYHDMVQALIERVSGKYIQRKPLKTLNFGLAFGMGKPKLVRSLGVDNKTGSDIYNAYHEGAPYVNATAKAFTDMALRDGQLVSILGRRKRFNLWEPVRERGDKDRQIALPRERAVLAYGTRIQRAYGHKALVTMLQMTEGDHMKKGMWQCYREGVFDVIGVPRITVHDELGFSVINTSPESEEAYAYMRHVMTNAIQLKIPVLYEAGRGPNWGAIE